MTGTDEEEGEGFTAKGWKREGVETEAPERAGTAGAAATPVEPVFSGSFGVT